MSRWKHILILSLLPVLADAQVLSSKGRFSVEFDRGCSPMTVNITENDSFGSVTRQYFYFEGADISNSRTFSYQDPGVYQIVQVVGVDGIDDRTDTLFIEAFDPIKPDFEIRKCSGLQISITSIDTYYDSLRIYFTSTDSVTLLNGDTREFSYSSNLPETITSKGFFQNADEICTTYFDEVSPIQVLQAPSIIDASIKESCKDIFTLYLNISEIDTLINYRINLNQGSTTSQIFDGFITQESLVFSDVPFDRTDFCLNIEAYDPCNGTSDVSTDFCSETSALSLSPFESLYSSYENSNVYINLDSVNSGIFNVYRRIEDEEFEFRSEQANSFFDPIGSIGRKYFYRIDYLDSCNQILFTAETNPPFVSAEKERSNQYLVEFSTPVNSLMGSAENAYQSGNDFSQTENSIPSQQFSVQLDAKDGSPRQFISASSTYSDGTILNSNSVTVRYELIIYVPNAFTPNGDGLNDTLELYGLPTQIATTKIYNRWGKLIYTSDQPSPGWDGTLNGSLAPQGTYLYEVTFETADGEKKTQKGTFALLKK